MSGLVAALTGTPGTGKSSVARLLAQRGFAVVDVGALVEEHGLHEGFDEARGSKVVDAEDLSAFLQGALKARGEKELVLEGHLSHLVEGVEVAVVLRCHPDELAERLRARGWSPAKVAENREAEALDVVLVEAVEQCPVVLEVDTTGRAAPEVADEVAGLLREPGEEAWRARAPGGVDWSGLLG